MNTTALSPGTVVAGPERNYTIVKVLGQGGFGITYLVEGPVKVHNITVDVKFAMKEHFISSLCSREVDTRTVAFSQPVAGEVQRSLRSFIKEAQRLQELRFEHPNIVKINEVFEANNTAYYVMEHLEGETLEAYVRRVGPLSVQDAAFFLRPIAEAVGQLHRNRLTHYDIKPANIIIAKGKDGAPRPVLIDFGLSKHYDRQGQATSTLSGGGYSPGYSPIEQYSGIKVFTPQADVYALAATMFYCLTGRTPAESVTVPVSTLAADLGAIPDAPIAALTHAMAIKVDDRTPDANAFVAEVFGGAKAGAGGGGGYTVPPISHPTEIIDDNSGTQILDQDEDSEPRSKKPLVIGIAAAVIVLLGVGWFLMTRGNGEPQPVPQEVASVQTPVQQEYGHAEAQHLDLAASKDGERRYFSVPEWNAVPDKGAYTKHGVVIIKPDKSGQTHRLILALNDNGYRIDWYDATARYASQMPTKEEGEAIVADFDNVKVAISNFGGSMLGPEQNFWTKTEFDLARAYAWLVDMSSGVVRYNGNKANTNRFRAVAPLQQVVQQQEVAQVQTPVQQQQEEVAQVQTPVQQPAQREYGHAQARHLDLAVRKGGEHRYFTLAEWNEVPDKSAYTKLGVVIIKPDESGRTHRLILALNDNGQDINWYDAMARYASQMPTKEEGEAIGADCDNVKAAIRSFGGRNAFMLFWTRTECGSASAWGVNIYSGVVSTDYYKGSPYRVRAVAPVP